MDVWNFISVKLDGGIDVQLLYVLKSEGSSPGRKGFKMAVAADGTFNGTIGGGIMEFKLVEKAKAMLREQEKGVILIRQDHDKEPGSNRSGMICSGTQLNAYISLSSPDKETIEKIISGKKANIQLSPGGITVVAGDQQGFQYNTDSDWRYTEAVNQQPVIHIIGGGHVGLALSELMNFLGFYVKLYDDRPGLNTISANSFAHEKHFINYEAIGEQFNDIAGDYVVIMTIGYRTDKIVLKQMLDKPFFYLGLLGSSHKINTLFAELKAEGAAGEQLSKVHSPVGLDINSKTTKEIAISIAAEIIREKNKGLP